MESLAAATGPPSRRTRLVIVADNSLIVEAIRAGLRRSGEFNLVGHADGVIPSAQQIASVEPDAILLDDMDQSDRALALIREIRAEHPDIAVILLSMRMDPDWLHRALSSGAIAAISKASHPLALGTLVRATLNGHIVHRLAAAAGPERQTDAVADDLPLTTREVEILQLVASGFTNSEVARKLWVTEQTVKFHLRNVYRKLDVANRTEASHFAHVKGLMGAKPALAAVWESPRGAVPA
jgi:DNA-binding NarL/FixJ family response regulator